MQKQKYMIKTNPADNEMGIKLPLYLLKICDSLDPDIETPEI